MPRGCGAAAMLGMSLASGAAAQAPRYDLRHLDSATFVEEVHSQITTQSGTAERHRIVDRMARFEFAVRADTMIATTDTVHLIENADGTATEVDVDAVIGARWAFLLSPRGSPTVIDAPVVPRSIADVSDLATAMDDFFPPAPPRMGAGTTSVDSSDRQWRRTGDSLGVERYHYSAVRKSNQRNSNDSIVVETQQEATETADILWEPRRGPLRWTRHISTSVTTQFAGRTVRAQVEQQVVVRRTQ